MCKIESDCEGLVLVQFLNLRDQRASLTSKCTMEKLPRNQFMVLEYMLPPLYYTVAVNAKTLCTWTLSVVPVFPRHVAQFEVVKISNFVCNLFTRKVFNTDLDFESLVFDCFFSVYFIMLNRLAASNPPPVFDVITGMTDLANDDSL